MKQEEKAETKRRKFKRDFLMNENSEWWREIKNTEAGRNNVTGFVEWKKHKFKLKGFEAES